MTRRILEIVGTLDRGAAQKQLLLLTAGLPRNQFEVYVAALAPGPLAGDFARQGTPLTVMGSSRRFDAGVWLRLRRHIKHIRPDVVHTWAGASTCGHLAALTAGARPVVSTRCDADLSTSFSLSAIRNWLARRTDVVIVDSSTLARPAANVSSQEVHWIPPGIGRCGPSDRTREQVLAELHLPRGTRMMATVAPLSWSSRIKNLVWAADLLKVIRDDTHLLVIGDGPQRAGLERYRRLCRIDERVHFLGFRHDLAHLLPHIGLLWQAGKTENLSMVVLEAMAAGVPVVAADTQANRELVIPGETGFLVPLGDRAGFSRRANTLLNDPELARRVTTAAQQRIAKDFTIESMVEKHAAVYRGM